MHGHKMAAIAPGASSRCNKNKRRKKLSLPVLPLEETEGFPRKPSALHFPGLGLYVHLQTHSFAGEMRLPQLLQAKDRQTFSIRSQIVNPLGLVNRIGFTATTQCTPVAQEHPQTMCKWIWLRSQNFHGH